MAKKNVRQESSRAGNGRADLVANGSDRGRADLTRLADGHMVPAKSAVALAGLIARACRERDGRLRVSRAFDAFLPLVGASIGLIGTTRLKLQRGGGGASGPQMDVIAFGGDWTQARPHFERYVSGGHAPDVCHQRVMEQLLRDCPLPRGTIRAWRRRDVMDDAAWYSMEHYVACRKPAGIDDVIYALGDIVGVYEPGDATITHSIYSFHRPVDAGAYSDADVLLVHAFVGGMTALFEQVQREDAAAAVLAALPIRLKSVLACLQNGDSEKQAAARIGLSKHTVHEYAKDLHRHFGVSSRGELLAKASAMGISLPTEMATWGPGMRLDFSESLGDPKLAAGAHPAPSGTGAPVERAGTRKRPKVTAKVGTGLGAGALRKGTRN